MKHILLTLLVVLMAKFAMGCSPHFTYAAPTSGSGLLTYSFTNTSTYDTGSSLLITTRLDFGPGGYQYIGKTGTYYHTFSSTGIDTVTLRIIEYDSVLHTTVCDLTFPQIFIVSYPACGFTISHSIGTDGNVNFTVNCPAGTSGLTYFWDFGDGTTKDTIGTIVPHKYAKDGFYNVSVMDSCVSCTYKNWDTVYITPHRISGQIYKDSTVTPAIADYKLWLIKYDSVSHTVTAVDSALDTGYTYANYAFYNVKPGEYLVKAAITNGSSTGSGCVPTYFTTSTSWSSANKIIYNTGIMSGQNISMQNGTVVSGPGFIAGDVRYGAGKSTGKPGDPVKGLLMMLRDVSGTLILSTYTDTAGHYSFSNIALGIYNVYPEDLGYAIVPAGGVSVSIINPSINGVNFKQTSTVILPDPLGVNSVELFKDIVVSPNPSSGKIVIEWNNNINTTIGVNIDNITGQKVFKTTLELKGQEHTELNLSQLEPGMYFMNIESALGHYTQKLLIQK